MKVKAISKFDGAKLGAMMAKRGYTTKSLSDEMGCVPGAINNYLAGTNTPGSTSFKLLCILLNCKEEDLLKDEPKPEPVQPTVSASSIAATEELMAELKALRQEVGSLKMDMTSLIKAQIQVTKLVNETKAQAEINKDEISGCFNKIAEVNSSLNKVQNKILHKFS